MILGFAHITVNRAGYAPQFEGHLPVVSAPEKWPLMARQAASHYLHIVQRDGDLRREIVEYDTGVVEQAARLVIDDGRITVLTSDTHPEIKFFRDGIGFKVCAAGGILLESSLPAWNIHLTVAYSTLGPVDPPLDIAGPAALAFYSSDVEADRDALLRAGGRMATAPFTVNLDREMKIVMLRSPEGTIIEVIQVQP